MKLREMDIIFNMQFGKILFLIKLLLSTKPEKNNILRI